MRPRASAKKYAAIWMNEGSPLAVYSERLRAGLEGALHARVTPVALAMLYTGGASVLAAIVSLRAAQVDEIFVVHMFPD